MARVAVIGGYGSVGRVAASALAVARPGQVTIAGRDLGRARACAREIGHGAEARRVDIADHGDALDDAALVLVCAEAPDDELARRCVARGVHYVDVTASGERLSALRELDSVARTGGATAVASVGLAPGVTNLLAAHVVHGLVPVPERVDVLVLLGLGDAHGAAAIEWTLAELAREHVFGERTSFRVPGRPRPVPAFSFGFPEGRTLPATLGVSRAASWLALDPNAATLALALGVRLRGGRLLRRRQLRNAAVRALGRYAFGPDAWAVAARAGGRQAALTGRRQARITGLVAADVTRRVLEGDLPTGSFHIEELLEPLAVLESLAAADPSVRLELSLNRRSGTSISVP